MEITLNTSDFAVLGNDEMMEVDGGLGPIAVLKVIGLLAAAGVACYELGKGVGEFLGNVKEHFGG